MRTRLKNLLPKSGFARNVGMLAGGTALGQGIVILASPVLTRLYTPEDFGYLAVYAALLAIIVVVGSLRYQLAIPLPETDEDAFNLLALSFIALLVVTGLISLILWGFGAEFFDLLNAGVLLPYLWLLPIGLLGAGAYQALSYWAIRKNTFRHLAVTKLTQGVGLVIAQVALGLFKLGPMGLIVGDVVGRVAGSGTLARLTFRTGLWKSLSLNRLKQNAIRYRRFPILSSGSALLNSVGLQLPSLMLLVFYGPQVAGWFSLSQRIIGIPMTLLGTSVSQVYVGKAAQLARESPSQLRSLFYKTASRLFLLAALPSLALMLFGPWLFALVFGSSWLQSGHYMRILAPMFLIQLSVVPLSQTLNILERQELQLLWDAGRFVLVFGTLWLAQAMAWTDTQAMIGFSVIMSLAYGGLLGLSLMALRQRRVTHD